MKVLYLLSAIALLAPPLVGRAGDLETNYQDLQKAVAAKDAAAVKTLAVTTSDEARAVVAEESKSEGDKELVASRMARARDIDAYTEYALYAMAVQSPPAGTVELIALLEQRNAKSKYLDDAYAPYFAAMTKTGASARIAPVAEAALKNLPANVDVLAVLTDAAWSARRVDRAGALATRLASAMARKPKPEGVSDAAWSARRNAVLAHAYWIAGLAAAAKNDFTDTDKNLRAALPLIAPTNEEMLAPALFHLGLANYQLGRQTYNRQLLMDAAKFSEQASKMKSQYAQQAWTNAHLIREELNRLNARR